MAIKASFDERGTKTTTSTGLQAWGVADPVELDTEPWPPDARGPPQGHRLSAIITSKNWTSRRCADECATHTIQVAGAQFRKTADARQTQYRTLADPHADHVEPADRGCRG